MEHFTVHIEIHRVTQEASTVQCRCPSSNRCSHVRPEPKRVDSQVVNVTTRVNGSSDADLDKAITKAVTHLDAERP